MFSKNNLICLLILLSFLLNFETQAQVCPNFSSNAPVVLSSNNKNYKVEINSYGATVTMTDNTTYGVPTNGIVTYEVGKFKIANFEKPTFDFTNSLIGSARELVVANFWQIYTTQKWLIIAWYGDPNNQFVWVQEPNGNTTCNLAPPVEFLTPAALGLPANSLDLQFESATHAQDVTLMNSMISGLSGAVASSNQTISTLEADLEDSNASLQICENALGVMTTDLDSCKQDNAGLTNSLAQKQIELNSCNTENNQLNANLNLCNSNLNSCSQENQANLTALNTCNTNLGLVNVDLNQCNVDRDAAHLSIDEKQETIDQQNLVISTQASSIENLSIEIQNLNTEISSMQISNADLEQQNNQCLVDSSAKSASITSLQNELTSQLDSSNIMQIDANKKAALLADLKTKNIRMNRMLSRVRTLMLRDSDQAAKSKLARARALGKEMLISFN